MGLRRSVTLNTLKYTVTIFGILVAINFSGLHLRLLEKDYSTEFSYPVESPNFRKIVDRFRNNDNPPQPYNTFYSDILFTVKSDEDCHEPFYFLLLVKSAPQNFENREVIRKTWMQPLENIHVKTVFFLGRSDEIYEEIQTNQDIAVIDFEDSYYNNTIKMMMEIKWAVENCPNFEYALLVDDDYFVAVKNLYQFTQDHGKQKNLYAGFSIFSSPLRYKIFNKWFIPLSEYPYDRFPPYITAGAILLSKSALLDIHYASSFVKPFRFDDIYVAICAKKMNITPTHSERFRFWEKSGEDAEKDLIASHGYRDPERLMKFWTLQSNHGYV